MRLLLEFLRVWLSAWGGLCLLVASFFGMMLGSEWLVRQASAHFGILGATVVIVGIAAFVLALVIVAISHSVE